ncbi:mobilization protein [Tamlana fucoidanivorans]|uniref:Mobilization protein n=1 Tax=Allotamlana fucoidanivorans TaxID=2583814 RepID=A0A5C4SPA0_9FLAO|nr:MobB family relaxase [Tamlana fucoidanivorans]TNJ46094.1 mobilization protein [Tamlana fucoidanivorans]
MYLTISPQKTGSSYLQSVSDFVKYLEKENDNYGLEADEAYFFNQDNDGITSLQVITDIDANTKKLHKHEPKFYSITINPSQRELSALKNHTKDLKAYTRELMKAYAASFHREIEGRAITVKDLKYFAKIEYSRSYKGTDKAVRENQKYIAKIAKLKHHIVKIERNEMAGSVKAKQQAIEQARATAPHKLNGKMIEAGMPKAGAQTHVHIIMSRKDQSNRYSLSPGSKYKASTVELNGKLVKRGFDRDRFYQKAEKQFDKQFNYKRHYVEQYKARKTLLKQPDVYLKQLWQMTPKQRALGFHILREAGIQTKLPSIPVNQAQLAAKIVKQLKKGLTRAMRSGSIEI